MPLKQSDVDFLKNYAAGGGTVLVKNPQGQYVPARSAPDTVVLQAAPPTTPLNGNAPGNQPGNAPGNNGNVPLTPAQQAAQQRAQQRQQQQQQRAQRQAAQRGAMLGVETVGGRFAALGDRVNRVSEWAGTKPTPGGITGMLVILGILISAVVPVNQGYTRLQLLWMTFLNQTFIPEAQAADTAREQMAEGNTTTSASTSGGNNQPGITLPTLPGLPGIHIGIPGLPHLGGGGGGSPAAPLAPGTTPASYGQLPIAPPMSSTGIRG